ncbi:Putative glutamine amidotransferase [Paraconexibacter sp. AEG42_29]|uniref:Glutamine amidotransferase n=1 Tax=Paraconexibacter sp. AEG42_29 TaxID=2997339 RepID=A0AAU7ASI6_9ACTN
MTARPPLIGVTSSEMRRDEAAISMTKAADPPHPEMALGMPYLRAIEAAGGIPVVLPPIGHDLAPRVLERLDGLCLSGGPDIDPPAYGAERHHELGPVEPALDEFEMTIVRQAVERGVPVLAICRGAQVLNVAFGGTLHQHLPEVSTDLDHRQHEPGTSPSHTVRTEPGSRVRELLGDSDQVPVNSFHHQAVDRIADGLRATAWAPDGTIEAIEGDGAGFVLGVQWHAETLVHLPEHAHLFAALVEAATAAAAVPAA